MAGRHAAGQGLLWACTAPAELSCGTECPPARTRPAVLAGCGAKAALPSSDLQRAPLPSLERAPLPSLPTSRPRSYLYRWRPADWCRANPTLPSFTLHPLECGYKKGTDKLHLRLPQVGLPKVQSKRFGR